MEINRDILTEILNEEYRVETAEDGQNSVAHNTFLILSSYLSSAALSTPIRAVCCFRVPPPATV